MAGLNLFRQDDFTGGLNLRADQFQLGENESPSMLNVEVDPRGGVTSRGGMSKIVANNILNGGATFSGLTITTESSDLLTTQGGDFFATEVTSGWNPKNLFAFNGSTHQLMLSTGFSGSTNGLVYYSTGGNFVSTTIPVANTDGASYAAWGSTLYVATGGQTYSWNGSTSTALLTSGDTAVGGVSVIWGTASDHAPRSNHAITHAGKMFVANTNEYVSGVLTSFPNRIRWSDESLVSPTRWTALNYIDINDGGQNITGLASFNGVLIVFKEFSVYAILGYNTDNFQVIQLSNKVGTVNQNSFCSTERGVYFFSWPDGLYFYNGKEILDVFENIRPILKTSKVNANSIDKIFVNNINNRVWVSLPYSENETLTYPSVSFVHDPTLGTAGWTMFQTEDRYGISGGCSFTKSDGTVINAAAHPVAESVLNVDITSNQLDNVSGVDSPFDSYYRTRWIDGRNYAMKKMFRRPDFVLKQTPTARTLTIGVYHDYEEASEQKEFGIDLPSAGSAALWGDTDNPTANDARWDISRWGVANQGAVVLAGSNLGLARSVQLKISGPTGLSWGVDSFTIKYNPRKVKA
jgi:hypothetical protein